MTTLQNMVLTSVVLTIFMGFFLLFFYYLEEALLMSGNWHFERLRTAAAHR